MADSWIFPEWPAPRGVHATVTTRDGPGVSSPPFAHFNLGLRCGDAPEAVASNRLALVQALDLPQSPRWLRQVHGARVALLGPIPADEEPQADAAVSRVSGTVLAILTADCLPVLLCADDGSEIAAVHAGWRGLAGGVLEATLGSLTTPVEHVLVWLGPCIGAASYEVGDEVRQAFVDGDPGDAIGFVANRQGHWLADLAGLARRRLQRAGVTQVFGGGFDTLADPRWYSFRRDGARSGRFASLIWTDPRAG